MTDRRPWALWAALSLIAFGILEAYATATRRIATLSATFTNLPRIVLLVIGIAIGTLAVHFWGDGWCPS